VRRPSSLSPACCLTNHAKMMVGYTADVLTDSLLYAEHARGGQSSTATTHGPVVPSLDDVRLAVQARTEGSIVPKEVRSFLGAKTEKNTRSKATL
jgi:hypothetical protein